MVKPKISSKKYQMKIAAACQADGNDPDQLLWMARLEAEMRRRAEAATKAKAAR
jgi:hypothetical protein